MSGRTCRKRALPRALSFPPPLHEKVGHPNTPPHPHPLTPMTTGGKTQPESPESPESEPPSKSLCWTNRRIKKRYWSEEENEALRKAVALLGVDRWTQVSAMMIPPGRSATRCRERWFNHLDPALRRGPWTPREDTEILRLHKLVGNRWEEIASHLPGRSGPACRSRHRFLLREAARKSFSDVFRSAGPSSGSASPVGSASLPGHPIHRWPQTPPPPPPSDWSPPWIQMPPLPPLPPLPHDSSPLGLLGSTHHQFSPAASFLPGPLSPEAYRSLSMPSPPEAAVRPTASRVGSPSSSPRVTATTSLMSSSHPYPSAFSDLRPRLDSPTTTRERTSFFV